MRRNVLPVAARAGVLVAAVGIASATGLLGHKRAACPEGTRADFARERAARDLAGDNRDADDAMRAVKAMCFGDREPGIMPNGVAIVPDHASPTQIAARAAHLGHHRRPGSPLATAPTGDCAAWVDRVIDEEAHAYALELAVLSSHNTTSDLPFAKDALAAKGDARVAIIGAWIRAHPDGGDGVAPLVVGYRAQCASAAQGEESR